MSCLYLLGSGHWVHCSPRNNTVVLRGYPFPDRTKNCNLNDRESSEWLADLLTTARKVSLIDANAHLAKKGFPIKITEHTWHEALQRLNALKWVPPNVPVIPWTPLREFYTSLREKCQLATHQTHAENIIATQGDAPELETLFQRSVEMMEAYTNLRDPLWPLERPWIQSNDTVLTPDRLVTLLNPDDFQVDRVQWLPPYTDLAFTPVGREVAPLRTRNAVYDDDETGASSGHGGMDLLLRSNVHDKLPIVGEIKKSGDTNLFLALVQALTYAVELTTTHQFERLGLLHENHFGDLPSMEHPRSDIYLIFLGEKPHHLHDQATLIADRLLATSNSPVASKVRRIAFVHADLVGKILRFDAKHIACAAKA